MSRVERTATRIVGFQSSEMDFQLMRSLGVGSFKGGDGLANIKCPTLAMAGAGEGGETAAQFERYCREVSWPVTRRLFTAEEGADMHCQLGNLTLSNAVVYDWLSEVFGK